MTGRAWKTALMSAVACCVLASCGASTVHDPKAGMNAESRLRVAEAAEASGDRELAVSMFQAAAAQAPSDNDVQLRCAEGLARSGQLDQASAILARSVKAGGHQPELLRTLGTIQLLGGQPAQAEATFTDLLTAKPGDVSALADKAIALDLERQHVEAQRLYRQALTLAPDDLAINNDLALSLVLSGHADEARQVLLPFKDVPNLPERVRINLGILEAADGNGADAQRILAGSVNAADLAMLTHAIEAGGTKTP
jgi:Flp pilus assembly protein TadD